MCLVSRIAKETGLLLISSSQPSPSPFPAVDMPHRIPYHPLQCLSIEQRIHPITVWYVRMCMYVYVSHCCNTPTHTTPHSSLPQCLLSLKIIIHIIPTGVRTKTKSFHWVHVANSSTITKGDPIPYHRTVLLCVLAETASHTHTTHPPSQEGTQEYHIFAKQAAYSSCHTLHTAMKASLFRRPHDQHSPKSPPQYAPYGFSTCPT